MGRNTCIPVSKSEQFPSHLVCYTSSLQFASKATVQACSSLHQHQKWCCSLIADSKGCLLHHQNPPMQPKLPCHLTATGNTVRQAKHAADVMLTDLSQLGVQQMLLRALLQHSRAGQMGPSPSHGSVPMTMQHTSPLHHSFGDVHS